MKNRREMLGMLGAAPLGATGADYPQAAAPLIRYQACVVACDMERDMLSMWLRNMPELDGRPFHSTLDLDLCDVLPMFYADNFSVLPHAGIVRIRSTLWDYHPFLKSFSVAKYKEHLARYGFSLHRSRTYGGKFSEILRAEINARIAGTSSWDDTYDRRYQFVKHEVAELQ